MSRCMLSGTSQGVPLALFAVLHGVSLSALPTSARAQSRAPAASSASPPSSAAPPATTPPASKGQQDLIARGLALFEDQQYEESIQTLSAALLRPNNTKAQKLDVYRLLALNYITLNRKEEAESAVRGLLSLEPGYALPARESPRFRDFFAGVKQRWEAEGSPGLVKEYEPPPAPVTMRHSSPPSADQGTQVDLTARLDDPARRVVDVKLYYRTGSTRKFEELTASTDDQSVRATIPGSAVKPPLVEYYLQGLDKGGLPVVTRGDATAPLRIAVPEASKGWILPVAIGSGVLGAAAIVSALALAGVFKGSSAPPGSGNGAGTSIVNISVGEAFR